MRTYFANLARPKRTAAAIQELFPLVQHAASLQLSAQLYGYRDWNELSLVTKRGSHAPSPDADEVPEEDRNDFIEARHRAFNSVFGLSPIGEFQMFNYLATHTKEAPPKRVHANGFPDGAGRMYRVLQTELSIPVRPKRTDPLYPPEYLTHDDRHGYDRIPGVFPGGEEAFLDALCKKAVKLKYGHAFADGLRASFEDEDIAPGPTEFTLTSIEGGSDCFIAQSTTQRLYVFDYDYNPVGLLIWTVSAAADQHNDDHNKLTVVVHEAWAAPRDLDTWDCFAEVLASELGYKFDLMLNAYFFPETTVGPKIEISLESESETLFVTPHGVLAQARDLFCDFAELPHSAVSITHSE